jgi:hypothetical protein
MGQIPRILSTPLLSKYGFPHRNHIRSDSPGHRRRRVRIGRVQLAPIQGIQNSVSCSPPRLVSPQLVSIDISTIPAADVSHGAPSNLLALQLHASNPPLVEVEAVALRLLKSPSDLHPVSSLIVPLESGLPRWIFQFLKAHSSEI